VSVRLRQEVQALLRRAASELNFERLHKGLGGSGTQCISGRSTAGAFRSTAQELGSDLNPSGETPQPNRSREGEKAMDADAELRRLVGQHNKLVYEAVKSGKTEGLGGSPPAKIHA